jgi:uncharacterized membrane protein
MPFDPIHRPPPAARVFRSRQVPVLAALGLASLLCLVLVALRVAHSGTRVHAFLLFNLALAWLPALAALAAYNLRGRSRAARASLLACGAVWLVFLPNAPYLVTDLVHLGPRPEVPLWYDVILLSTFAWTGLFLGLVSLAAMQAVVRRQLGGAAGWVFVVGSAALVGYGVYAGRFLRWNSWDVVRNPAPLVAGAAGYLRHPLAHWEATVFSLIVAAVFFVMYATALALAHFARESDGSATAAAR